VLAGHLKWPTEATGSAKRSLNTAGLNSRKKSLIALRRHYVYSRAHVFGALNSLILPFYDFWPVRKDSLCTKQLSSKIKAL
jgi:hypothetical protein